jgi:hypothetical protein
MSIIQPTKATLLECTIGGVPWVTVQNGSVVNYFHVQELRIYEDNCKFYFTGQLVIETQLNVFERFLSPQAEVVIAFVAPPNNFIYRETFRVYAYESKPREGDIEGSMVTTISLLGDEYFKDKSETVQVNIPNQTATVAARKIHDQYIGENGGLVIPQESVGMIGQQLHPHQVLSKKPSKAIHDLLDKAVFPVSSSGPGVYFRNKKGYVIAALEYLITTAPFTGNYYHKPAGGANLEDTLAGYQNVLNFRPMAPPGDDRGGARGGEAEGRNRVFSAIDLAVGNSKTGRGSGGTGFPEAMKYIADSYRQAITIDKNGPGGFQAREDAFITQLTYSPKYWLSVPLQSGINVTVGERVRVTYPVSDQITTKNLWVARLIHELRFTEGRDRTKVTVNGTTDIFGVDFQG